MSKHSEKAVELFREGYNCSQSVFLAFNDKTKLDDDLAKRIASSFGGGMGRLREVCGALTGAFMVAGVLYGYTIPKEIKIKGKHYKRIQGLAKKFEDKNGSIICRELLGLGKDKFSHIPSERTKEYYKKRPCVEMVRYAAELMDELIEEIENT